MLAPVFGADETPLDFNKAREIFKRRQSGGTVTSDEEAYIRQVMAVRQRQQDGGAPAVGAAAQGIDWARAQQLHAKAQRGEKLTEEEQAYYEKAKAARGGGGAVPLSDARRWQRLRLGRSISRQSPNSARHNTRARKAAFTAVGAMSRRKHTSTRR